MKRDRYIRGNSMYKIKQAKFSDMKFLINMAAEEGWDPGIYDNESFFAADNNGFFVGELDGELISCISAVKYNSFGFIGFYIVKPEYRGLGYGIRIWEHALDYFGDINIGLDGVVSQVENYKKLGFKLAHNNARYSGKLDMPEFNDKNIIKADLVNFDSLCDYDKLHFGFSRRDFLRKWINQDNSFSICYLDGEKITGFSTCRKTIGGFKIGPLFARDKDIAEIMFLYLGSKIGNFNFYLDINENFEPAVELVKKYNMNKIFETKRMYTKSQPDAKWNEVFGITSFELG